MAFKRNILIVDDESAILDFLRDGLSSYLDRFNVYTASSGDEALRIMDGHRITLLITDIRMPIMDGFELIRDAKAKNPDTRFIVMTAYGSDEIFEKSMEYGAIDYIKKPFDFDLFSRKMFRALEPAKGFRASSFHGFHLTDALQLVHMVRKSQTIRVKTEFGDECWIHLKDGEVVPGYEVPTLSSLSENTDSVESYIIYEFLQAKATTTFLAVLKRIRHENKRKSMEVWK